MVTNTERFAVFADLLMVWSFPIWPILLPLGIGTVVGWLAIILALSQRLDSARVAAWFSITVGTLNVAVFGLLPNLYYLFREEPALQLMPIAYIVLGFPFGLGAIGLGFCRWCSGMAPTKSGQVTLPVVFCALTAIAFGLAVFRLVHVDHHRGYHRERDRYVAHFQSIPGVESIRIEPHEHEGCYYVGAIEFTIKDLPGSFVKLGENSSMLDQPDKNVEHLYLRQIGPWQFRVQNSSCLILGQDGRHSHLVPFEIHSVTDIVERYNDLVAFVQNTEIDGVAVMAAENDKIVSD